jgi:hypothetical protein
MSLSRKTAAALDDRLAAGGAAGDLTVEHEGRTLAVALTEAAPVGVAFDRLEFRAAGREDRPLADLRAWGDRLAAALTYLMEPLVVLEVDEAGGEVELRSEKPSRRGDARSYYEVRLTRPWTLALARVSFDDADRRRRPARCQFSREAFERLVEDLERTAG